MSVIGGHNIDRGTQIPEVEVLNIHDLEALGSWETLLNLRSGDRDLPRSRTAACALDSTQILVLGGVSRQDKGLQSDILLIDTARRSCERVA